MADPFRMSLVVMPTEGVGDEEGPPILVCVGGEGKGGGFAVVLRTLHLSPGSLRQTVGSTARMAAAHQPSS